MNCWFCERDVSEYPSVLVDSEVGVVPVCTDCMDKADSDEPWPVDMDRESRPEFNGSLVA